jgi:hypothetical protein
MSVFVHVQTGGKKETFLRGVCEDFSEEAVVAKVRQMFAHPDAHNLSRSKPKSPWRTKAYKPDEEVLPGMEVSAKVEKAMADA